MKKSFRRLCWLNAGIFACVLSNCLSPPKAAAEVIREDHPVIQGAPKTHYYVWRETNTKPKAIALAVHGLVMHGGVYDRLARELASRGFLVIAPDLRGYGRWMRAKVEDESTTHSELASDMSSESEPVKEPFKLQAAMNAESVSLPAEKSLRKIQYHRSYEDLVTLTKALRSEYPSLPLYCIGESLGAGMALHLASEMPGSFDGLVLSSPAIKRRTIYFAPRMVFDVMGIVANPRREVDLAPYISRWASEDPQVIKSALKDPLVRKRLKAFDLLKTAIFIRSNVRYAENIPSSMPVLVIQGDRDRMLKTNGVVLLLSHLRCKDQTIKWFYGKGHLLLETKHVAPETIDTVGDWLVQHSNNAANRTRIIKASLN
ncbi:MAG: lysophospholipase [Cyanobacteria bacterium]|nr:lysophospholipase [Cyanobacteriota bacterium]